MVEMSQSKFHRYCNPMKSESLVAQAKSAILKLHKAKNNGYR